MTRPRTSSPSPVFAIPDGAGGWSPETDGPLGAVQLAGSITLLGGRARILTDSPYQIALKEVAPPAVAVDVARLGRGDPAHSCPEIVERYRELGVTHLVSVERAGPTVDGRPRNMRGEDIGAATPCLTHVVAAGPWPAIAAAEGGNEIGMGRVPAEIGGTSNWGAAALVAGTGMTTGRADVLELLSDERGRELVDRLVAAGAVDSVTRTGRSSVGGLDWAGLPGRGRPPDGDLAGRLSPEGSTR